MIIYEQHFDIDSKFVEAQTGLKLQLYMTKFIQEDLGSTL